MSTLWLTQIDGLALKVEVFQHQHKEAALRGGLHPTAHLAALDVIPGGEGWGRQNSMLYRLETHRKAHKVMKQEQPLGDCSDSQHNPSPLSLPC